MSVVPRVVQVALLGVACLLVVLAGTAAAASADPLKPVRLHGHGHWFRPTCKVPAKRAASCNALIVTNSAGTPLARNTPAPGALGPQQLAKAYGLPTSAPAGATIGIVDAYDDPNIEADLATYSSYYGLPACTTANGCFRKVNQSGGTTLPSRSTDWGEEISLDVEIAHGICQTCKIVLVEATSPTFANLGTAVNQAVAEGATVVSNSYGGSESAGQTSWDTQYFRHPGVIITASTGDSGYGVQYPAAAPGVVAVGGTTLTLAGDGSYGSETAWAKGGSGCSAYEPRPAWQTGASCARRSVADVSADADPNSGAAIYDSYGGYGWLQIGGTSLSSPLIAAVYALAGNTTVPQAPYANPGALHDVTSGGNGSCGGSSLCQAGAGYDGPTGLGTPNGLAAFAGAPVSPDYALSVTPSSQSATQGGTATYTVTLTPNATFASGSVAISAASAPNDVSFTGCTSPLTAAAPSCSLSVVTTAASAASSHALTVTGAGASLPTHTAGATLGVSAPLSPDFGLSVSPLSQSVTQGGQASYLVSMTPNATFGSGSSVTVSGGSVPDDVFFAGCAAALTAISPTCTLTVSTTAASAATSHALTVTGAGSTGLGTHTAPATLGVTVPLAPDYTLSVSPGSQTVTQGQTASYTVSITPNASFGAGDSVVIGASSAPADVTPGGCAAALTIAAPTCTLTIGTAGASLASHTLTVTGTGSGSLQVRSAGASLTVQAVAVGDFTLALSPTSRIAFTPVTVSYTITITRTGGFSSPVALAVSGLPAGATTTFASPATGPTATLTVTLPKTSFGTYHVTVTGTSGSLVHTATASMTTF